MNANDLVREVGNLFSLPDVVLRINELIEDGDASASELAEVVELDAGLTAAVLKLANSAWYGLSSRVDTVSAAVVMIGQQALRDLAVSASVVKSFRGIPEGLIDMHAFWDNSTTCGVLARQLAQRAGIREGERMFIAGLLLGVGKLVFIARRPEQYRQVLALEAQGDAAMVAEEKRLFGFGYAELGAELLRAWKLPVILQTVVGSHLSPLLARAWPQEIAIAHLAADIAAHVAPAFNSRQAVAGYLPACDAQIWQRSGLAAETIPEVLAESLMQAFEILEIINPRALQIR